MKLIDAESIPWEVEGVGEIPVITKEEIDEMPTVEAIPIEWIEQKMKELDTDTYEYEWLIAQWRIENYGKTD